MAARFPLPNGAVLEVASLFGVAVPFTTITNAAPPVLTAVGHGLDNDTVVLVDSGWSKIADRAAKIAGITTDSFTLRGLNTSNTELYTPGSGLGSVIPVSNWVQIPKVTALAVAGGEQQYLTTGYLEEDDDRQMPTNRNPLTMTITVEDQPALAYVTVVEGLSDAKTLSILRLKLRNGDQILYPGYVSISDTPTTERNALMTRTISVGIAGRPMRYLAA